MWPLNQCDNYELRTWHANKSNFIELLILCYVDEIEQKIWKLTNQVEKFVVLSFSPICAQSNTNPTFPIDLTFSIVNAAKWFSVGFSVIFSHFSTSHEIYNMECDAVCCWRALNVTAIKFDNISKDELLRSLQSEAYARSNPSNCS